LSLGACASAEKKVKFAEEPKISKETEATSEVKKIELKEVEPPVVAEPLETVHVVQANESLGKIAKSPKVYGTAHMWPVLFEANRDVLTDPAKIYPGQKLRIPRDPDEIKKLKAQSKTDLVVKEALPVKVPEKIEVPIPAKKAVPVPTVKPQTAAIKAAPPKPKVAAETLPTVYPIRTVWSPPPSVPTAKTVKVPAETKK